MDPLQKFIDSGLIDPNYKQIEERMLAKGKFIPFLSKEIQELHRYMEMNEYKVFRIPGEKKERLSPEHMAEWLEEFKIQMEMAPLDYVDSYLRTLETRRLLPEWYDDGTIEAAIPMIREVVKRRKNEHSNRTV